MLDSRAKEAMVAVVDNVKDFIYDYARYMHLNLMPAAVRARFSDYEKNKDFSGHMKDWPDILANIKSNDWPSLTDDKYQELYALFQNVFENMNRSVSKDRDAPKAVKDFVNQWFGKNKLFQESEIIPDAQRRLEHFVKTCLKPHLSDFEIIFKNNNLLPQDCKSVQEFIKKLEDCKYNPTDDKLRDALPNIIGHAQYFSRYGDPDTWPKDAGEYNFTQDDGPDAPAVDTDTTKWFQSRYNPAFKNRLPEIMQTLVSKPKVFDYFQQNDTKGTISKNIQGGIEKTNYADSKTDDYVPEKDKDELNVFQKIEKAATDFKENQVDPWANILRGSRRFFSPAAKTIIEACSKVKTKDGKRLKPTDGLKGILAAKDDIAKKIATSPTARDHWKWISGKLEAYSTSIPKAFEGALRNPRQMKKLVSKFIMDAIQEGKVDQAKTALEMISTLKYGIMHSRTVDALAKEDFTILSDKGLSWNKYEGVKFVTTAMDKTTKFALLAVGRGVAAVHNKWMRDHTKFRGKDKMFKGAHDAWKKQNSNEQIEQSLSNVDNDITAANTDYAVAQGDIAAAGYKNQNELSKDINAKQTERTQHTNQLNILNTNLQNAQQREDELNKEKQDAENKTKEALQKRNALSAEIKDLQNKIQDWENNVLPTLTDSDEISALKHKILDVKLAINNKTQERTNIVNEARIAANTFRTKKQEAIRYHNANIVPLNRQITAEQDEIQRLDNYITPRQNMLQDFQDKKENVLDLKSQKRELQNIHDTWDDKHKDQYVELMAYWDMLESFWKSHQLTFAADKMRKNFLKDYDKGNSKAQTLSVDFLAKYKKKYNMAA